jgi:hypothetical protein
VIALVLKSTENKESVVVVLLELDSISELVLMVPDRANEVEELAMLVVLDTSDVP